MKNRLCISTIVSTDYQWFLPLFVTSSKLAYTDAGVKIFVKGDLCQSVKDFLDSKKVVYKSVFDGIKLRKGTCNALRHLISPHEYAGFDYVYPTDVDFIIFPHKIRHVDYYARIMKSCGTPFAAARGPLRGFGKPKGVGSWDGPYTRIAAGCSMYKYPRFYDKTRKAREHFLHLIKTGKCDAYDKSKRIVAGSYRSFDEVMLYRMMRMSGLKTPKWKNHFSNHEKSNAVYRDIHLGDFKFPHRYGNINKMRRILANENVKRFLTLEKNKSWQEAVNLVGKNSEEVFRLMKKLRLHIEKRTK